MGSGNTETNKYDYVFQIASADASIGGRFTRIVLPTQAVLKRQDEGNEMRMACIHYLNI
jgi:hypothetical protein